MKISHEVPLCLLNESRSFNDYDYALVHLFDTHPDYYTFYKESVRVGRHVLLDNSLFELEVPFDLDKFASYVRELNPTEYIVPDSLENMEETIKSFESFLEKYPNLSGKKIGVVQGKTWEELVECYRYMSEKADKIAISFDYSYYLTTSPSYMEGRIKFISDLLEKEIVVKDKPHHLLGCYLPQEFTQYRHFDWIETVDTSNPVVHAIKNIRYTEKGLLSKEKIKLVDLLCTKREDIDTELLNYNVNMFRGFCNGK